MKIGLAFAIFSDIHRDDVSVEEKLEAIKTINGLETHNGVAKRYFIEVIDWLLERERSNEIE